MTMRRHKLSRNLLLALLAVLAIGGGLAAVRVQQVASTQRELASRGIHVSMIVPWEWGKTGTLLRSIEEAFLGKSLVSLDAFSESGGDVTDENWIRSLSLVHRLPHVCKVSLRGRKITDRSVESLGQFSALVSVGLSGSNISDDALQNLAELRELRALDLSDTPVTGTGLKALERLPRLQRLNLDGAAITEQGLKSIASLKHLASVSLSNTGLAESDVMQLELAVPGVQISDD